MTDGPTITRSKGIIVGGFNPGGGRSGLDPALDRIVQEAAERLGARYGIDVEIRFNSDRLSGGAFLNLPYSVGINAQSVSITALRAAAVKHGWDAEEDIVRMGVDPEGGDGQIVLRVYVDARGLKDRSNANCDGRTPYMYVAAADLEDAMTKLEEAYDS